MSADWFKKSIEPLHRLKAELDRLEAERDQARAWAKAWKRAAKGHRASCREQDELRIDLAMKNWALREKNKRLREALEQCRMAFPAMPVDVLGHNEHQGWPYLEELASRVEAALKGSSDG